jgi:hypothetical protein
VTGVGGLNARRQQPGCVRRTFITQWIEFSGMNTGRWQVAHIGNTPGRNPWMGRIAISPKVVLQIVVQRRLVN